MHRLVTHACFFLFRVSHHCPSFTTSSNAGPGTRYPVFGAPTSLFPDLTYGLRSRERSNKMKESNSWAQISFTAVHLNRNVPGQPINQIAFGKGECFSFEDLGSGFRWRKSRPGDLKKTAQTRSKGSWSTEYGVAGAGSRIRGRGERWAVV